VSVERNELSAPFSESVWRFAETLAFA